MWVYDENLWVMLLKFMYELCWKMCGFLMKIDEDVVEIHV